MATKSLYQKQADTRTKTALRLRARFDARVRKYATALGTALMGAADAKARIDRLNALYNVDISTETDLVHALRTANLAGSLTTALGGSLPGEEKQLFNASVDGNDGAVLALEAVFGEVAGTPAPATGTTPATGTGNSGSPAPAYDTTLTGPNASQSGVTLAAQSGDTLGFTALLSGSSAPASMDVYIGSQQVASVAYTGRYEGRPFTFTVGTAGAGPHTGAFAATVNF